MKCSAAFAFFAAFAFWTGVANAQPVTSGDVQKGKELYLKYSCYACHGYDGHGGAGARAAAAADDQSAGLSEGHAAAAARCDNAGLRRGARRPAVGRLRLLPCRHGAAVRLAFRRQPEEERRAQDDSDVT